MKLAKVKTDKSDAKVICQYALVNEVPLTDVQAECLQLFRLLDSYIKKRTATKNKIHGEETLGVPSKFVYRSLKRDIKHLNKEIAGIEERLLSLVKKEQQQQLTLLTTIPGIGIKTALFLIVVTDSFSKFETAAQLCSYVGGYFGVTMPLISVKQCHFKRYCNYIKKLMKKTVVFYLSSLLGCRYSFLFSINKFF
jgi:transposase